MQNQISKLWIYGEIRMKKECGVLFAAWSILPLNLDLKSQVSASNDLLSKLIFFYFSSMQNV